VVILSVRLPGVDSVDLVGSACEGHVSGVGDISGEVPGVSDHGVEVRVVLDVARHVVVVLDEFVHRDFLVLARFVGLVVVGLEGLHELDHHLVLGALSRSHVGVV